MKSNAWLAVSPVSTLSQTFLLRSLITVLLASSAGPLLAQAVKYNGATPAVDFGNANVCPAGATTPAPCSKTVSLSYKVVTGGELGTPKVVTTGGVQDLDFTATSGTTCTGVVTTGSSCVVTVKLTPRVAGARSGAVEITDSSGNVLATTFVYGNGIAAQIAFGPGVQQIVDDEDDGIDNPTFPQGIAVDAAGNVFVSYFSGGGSGPEGEILEFPAGGGSPVIVSVSQPVVQPVALAIDGAGNLFISDDDTGIIKTSVSGGNAVVLDSDFGGATLAVDGAGDLFALNGILKKYPAGGGAAVQVSLPPGNYSGFAVDGPGNIYLSSSTQLIEVPAAGGPATVLAEGKNLGIAAVDRAGNFYSVVEVSYYIGPGREPYGTYCIMEVPRAGGGTRNALGCATAGGAGGLALDDSGNIYMSLDSVDEDNDSLVIQFNRSDPPSLTFDSTPVGTTSKDSPMTVAIDNIGNETLEFGDLNIIPDSFVQVPGSGLHEECTGVVHVLPGKACNLSISVKPIQSGQLDGAVKLAEKSPNGAYTYQVIPLSGTATAK